ncbi:MAG: 30S ribosomal protein S20 [Chthonomonadales bacterium]
MPNIKSVKKDVIKSRKNHLRNVSAKSAMKTFIKKARTAVEAGDPAAASAAVAQAVSVIDKTAERGIIHKNAAARRKSRLMKRLAKLSAPQA